MPVPAGMSLPMMTFSFRPSSESDRAWIAASVSTRVVSWNDAADSHYSVASDAFVMPLLTDLDVLTLLDPPLPARPLRLGVVPPPGHHPLRDRVLDHFGAVVRRHDELRRLVGLLDRDASGDLADRRAALRLPRLEQLDH